VSVTPQAAVPSRRSRHVRALLIAAGLLVVLAGCKKAPVDARAEVQKMVAEVPTIVTDSTRAAAVQSAYRRLGDVMLQSIDERRQLADHWNRLYRRYDTPRESLEAVITQTQLESGNVRAAAIQAREEMRIHTTAKEWKALGASRKSLVSMYLMGTP
jgi:hypothetical protein